MSENKKGRLLRVLLRLTLGIFVLLTAAVIAFGVWAAGVSGDVDASLFEEGTKDRTTRLYCYDERGDAEELVEDRLSGYENALFCSLDDMPNDLKNAFIAIEDKRFYSHRGVDWRRTASAAFTYLKNGGHAPFGGSTITQQLIKNLTGEAERSASRKVSEILRAAKAERKYDKDTILEYYLNVVNLAENCYGVRTASNAYFSKEPADLSLTEAAALAAITNNPARYDPIKHPEANRTRRDLILSEMRAQGMIDEAAYQAARQAETVLCVNEKLLSGKVNSWYADMVIADVIADLQKERGLTAEEAARLVFCGGLQIYTAESKDVQKILCTYYEDKDRFPTHKGGRKAESAMMIVDPVNGDILAVAGAVGKKTTNRIQNYAVDAKRPSGSVIKPIGVYGPALERGVVTWSTVFDDVPRTFKEDGAPWPRNSPDVYRGLTTVSTALTHSVNTVSVSILEQMGTGASFRFLHDTLGMTSLDKEQDMNAGALALGQQTNGVTLRELLGAYTAAAGDGVYRGTRSYYKVLDNKGELLLTKAAENRPALSRANAAVLTLMLRRAVREGTGRALTLKDRLDVAGKTGTSSDCCDKWFVGYTPELLAGVWYGFEYPEPLDDVKGNPALTAFDGVMGRVEQAHPAKKRSFDTPPDVAAVRYCADSGGIPTDVCALDPRGDRTEIGYFVKGTEPSAPCDRHTLIDYCEGGGVATPVCPAEARHPVALLRVTRQFPRPIRVLDAPYTCVGECPEKQPDLTDNAPYYALNFDKNRNFGIGMDVTPFNRACPEHGGDPFLARRLLPYPKADDTA